MTEAAVQLGGAGPIDLRRLVDRLLEITRVEYVDEGVPDAQTTEAERRAIPLVAEVTTPVSPDTALNDRAAKPKPYAKARIPLYLLIDQEVGRWTLHALAEGWQRYQVAADGKYGEQVPLPAPFGIAIATDDWPRYQA